MPKKKPIITKVEDVAGTKWLAMRKATYAWPGEAEKTWDFVTRPTRKGKTDAIVVVPFLANPNRIVVIREFRVPINDYELGFPAGLIDGKESIEHAARRELKEETGLKLEKVIQKTPPLYTSAGLTDENVVLVFANCSGELTDIDNEDEKIFPFALDYKAVESVLKEPPYALSARLWPILQAMYLQGYVGWSDK